MLVRRVVVQNQVNVKIPRSLLINEFEKPQPFLVPMPWCPLGNDFAIEVIEGRKECQGPMPVIIVGAGLKVTLP